MKRYKAPHGSIIAVQVDNELGYFFHINSYMCDYSEASIKRYREFLKGKYETADKLNGFYQANYESFDDVEPPRRFDGTRKEELLYYVDWIEYRERYLINSLGRLARMLKERGLDGVPMFHNYPHPLGPGGSTGATTTPFNLPELEKELDFVGFDIYSRKELYDHVKTIATFHPVESLVEFSCHNSVGMLRPFFQIQSFDLRHQSDNLLLGRCTKTLAQEHANARKGQQVDKPANLADPSCSQVLVER